ncbi:sigma 54-interacting transcriptional regulator [Sorangium sp. So ce448]|uniref:sigma 54-interacting transcriptional regulator n=1 Tax=Sorangium sp. So ce448 TaxID=3133314 RepID=UPI003F61A4B1
MSAPTARAERARPPLAQSLRITVLAGSDAGRSATIAERRASIGRARSAELCLSDPAVSSFHVELSSVEGGLRVRDLESTNGTYFAGALIESAVVPSGAVLELGDSRIRVEAGHAFALPSHDARSFGELRGASAAMRELFHVLAKVARTELAVLFEGATGTGKELAARAVHAASACAGGPFVVLDCTAIPGSLAESVLFGHDRGAFTGASEARGGIFEAADGGTLFLDEIGELPLELQPKLLRVLERREVLRVGSTAARPLRVRVLSATWRDLRAMVNQGRFREDLYFRLVQARVELPPLDAHREDVALLVGHFLASRPAGAPGARAISDEALDELCGRDYRGNVRELKSVVERAAALADGEVVTAADLAFERMLSGERRRAPHEAHRARSSELPPEGAPGDALAPFKEAKRGLIEEFERDYLTRLLARAGNNISRAAALAGLERHSLRDLLRKHGLRDAAG